MKKIRDLHMFIFFQVYSEDLGEVATFNIKANL